MHGLTLPIPGFELFDEEHSFKLEDVVNAIKIIKSDIIINNDIIINIAGVGVFSFCADNLLVAKAKGEKYSTATELITIKKKEVIKLVGYLEQTKLINSQQEPIPTKGKPETLTEWVRYVIEVEKGLSLSDEMPDGFQARLIERAEKHGYRDGSAMKKAWAALGLKSARKTTKMKKPPKTP